MTSSQQKKWRLLRSYLARHPIWCAWQVTYRCNFRCRFCHYWRDPMAHQPEQTIEQFALGARKLAQWGSILISLAGGEPLLRDDITEIVEVIGRWHFPFITTNGYLADEKLAHDLFAAGLWGVSISIDYTDPARHDRARGIDGAYHQAVRALKLFSAARRYRWQRVNLMAVLLDDNLDQVEPLIQLAADHDAYFMIQPYCTLKTSNTKFIYKQNGTNHTAASYLLNLRRRYPNFLSNPTFLQRFDAALDGGVPNCAAGNAFFNIDSTGNIAICVEQRPQPVANLYHHNATQINQRLRNVGRNNHCQKCWYNCRGEVESLYNIKSLLQSLPTLLHDRGRPNVRDRDAQILGKGTITVDAHATGIRA